MSESEYDIARDLWLRRNQPREALAHALKAVDLDEGNAEAAHLVALLYLDFCSRGPTECRLSEAEKHARLALRNKPDFREAKNTLARGADPREKIRRRDRRAEATDRGHSVPDPGKCLGKPGLGVPRARLVRSGDRRPQAQCRGAAVVLRRQLTDSGSRSNTSRSSRARSMPLRAHWKQMLQVVTRCRRPSLRAAECE